MSATLVEGPVTVAVPATSANLGPGFDSLGLALELRDEVTAEIVDSPGVEVTVRGEGEGALPMGARHLVAATVLRALADVGVSVPGLRLSALNRIPHGRGLGSSAAAIVAAVALARELTGAAHSPISLDRAFDLSVAIEGHPDNVAPALLGGLTIAWPDASTGLSRAVTLAVHPSIRAIVCVPADRMSTKAARGLLPATVAHADAATNAARSALLVHALTSDPSLVLDATADLLHQSYRCPAMPLTGALLDRLRADGLAATVSGSGPSVLVLTDSDVLERVRSLADGFEVRELVIASEGVRATR
ncbi:MAG: homoserine kinase [Actinobacteria bacterium]|uniref:Homoserine kinase n=1 Tax=freshwater metagenome TaxID=449393 RepID=A0A6J7RAY5_9ZZZZ|nr:homoserine kinase [Actinomycetota bacterium]MSW41006.1 homoserine kinase [Actinomycetota bacterium]